MYVNTKLLQCSKWK